jgi:hypothetical protein
MRVIANLFLILFLTDGAVSLFDELFSLLAPMPVLSQLRTFLADVVILMAFTVFQALGIDKRLPKRIFLPLIFFVCLVPIGAWAFPSLAAGSGYGLLAALLQLLLCLWPIYNLKQMGEPGMMMPKTMFNGPFFSLKNTVVFTGISLFVIPLVSLLLLFATANSFMQRNTSGFMRLGPGGVYMTEKVYQRDNKTVRLVGMIHMGEKGYYDDLVGSIVPGRTIILAEGVSDNKKLLPNRLDYGKVANYLGLTLQQEKMHFKGRLIETIEPEKPSAKSRNRSMTPRVDILRADVDVSSFRPPTIGFLDELGKQMKEESTSLQGLTASSALSAKYMTPEIQKVIMEDILYRRNQEVIRHLNKAVPGYDTVVIPWGAMHMPEIEAEVLREGFKLQQVHERLSIDFRKVLKAKS